MKISILKVVLQNALIAFRAKYKHLLLCPQKRFNVGDKVLICGKHLGVVIRPVNDDFDAKYSTWVYVYNRGYASNYANCNLTLHADQSVSK